MPRFIVCQVHNPEKIAGDSLRRAGNWFLLQKEHDERKVGSQEQS
jgi:hypothetical protein